MFGKFNYSLKLWSRRIRMDGCLVHLGSKGLNFRNLSMGFSRLLLLFFTIYAWFFPSDTVFVWLLWFSFASDVEIAVFTFVSAMKNYRYSFSLSSLCFANITDIVGDIVGFTLLGAAIFNMVTLCKKKPEKEWQLVTQLCIYFQNQI